MTNDATKMRRVLAARLQGEKLWKAAATDGAVVGHGVGYTWHAAVSEAVHEIDEKHTNEEQKSCGTR